MRWPSLRQAEGGQRGGPVGLDRVLGVGERNLAVAHRLLQGVLYRVLIGGGVAAGVVAWLGPQVAGGGGVTAELEGDEVVLLVVGGARVAVPVLRDLLHLEGVGVGGRRAYGARP